MNEVVIVVDFDGTCVTHDFPRIGKDIGAERVLKKIIDRGYKLVLFTMRSDREEGDYLTQAVNWFKQNEIPLYGIQTNPTQTEWTSSPKADVQIYIDDAALGAPLTSDGSLSDRPFIDWYKVEEMLGL